jgi:hypothetical protein
MVFSPIGENTILVKKLLTIVSLFFRVSPNGEKAK